MSYKVTIHPECLEMLNELSFYVFRHKGFLCCIARMGLGQLNGYVAVPEGHPYFGNGYDEVDVEVHGGLTYSHNELGFFENGLFGNLYWFGFDTAHAGDLLPYKYGDIRNFGFQILNRDTYKNFEYVKAEVISLANQFASILPL